MRRNGRKLSPEVWKLYIFLKCIFSCSSLYSKHMTMKAVFQILHLLSRSTLTVKSSFGVGTSFCVRGRLWWIICAVNMNGGANVNVKPLQSVGCAEILVVARWLYRGNYLLCVVTVSWPSWLKAIRLASIWVFTIILLTLMSRGLCGWGKTKIGD